MMITIILMICFYHFHDDFYDEKVDYDDDNDDVDSGDARKG